jgi:SPP1 family phage portal protein
MYPMEPTFIEQWLTEFKANATNSNEKIIQWYVDNNDTTKMSEGVRYYENENDILNRQQYAVIDGAKVVDAEKPNNRIPHGWHKLLVDQKTAYLVGEPINFAADDKKLTEYINDYLGEKWDDTANELVKGASNKGIEWLQPYIDEEGNFDFLVIPAEQYIPIYEGSKQKKQIAGIRYYPININGVASIRAEFWDDKYVTFYIKMDGEFVLDTFQEENPQSHFYHGSSGAMNGYGWGRVPFIKFRNNEQEKGDLAYYKQLIDSFDKRVSDNQNSFDELQELITILKGYEGTDLSEFMQNMKYYKAIKVDSDGGVESLKQEVPIASIDSHLDRMRESIFTFGGGVDIGTTNFGNSPSGIALKFLYSLLDMKSNTLERKFRQGIQELLWFLCEYLSISGKGQFDYKAVDFTFKRSMMVNELEQATIAQNSKGIISDKTIIAHHPWTSDLEQELQYLEEEKAAYAQVNLEAVTPIVTGK